MEKSIRSIHLFDYTICLNYTTEMSYIVKIQLETYHTKKNKERKLSLTNNLSQDLLCMIPPKLATLLL